MTAALVGRLMHHCHLILFTAQSECDRMAEHKAAKGQMHTECIGDCDTICNFLKLTDEMVKTILELDEELLRWRQAPIKYLPPEWTEGL